VTTRVTTILEPDESKAAKFLRAAKYADFSVLTNCLGYDLGVGRRRVCDYPVWVRRCGRRVARALFPRLYRSVGGKSPSRAYEFGLAVGMMETGQKMLEAIAEEIGPLPMPKVTRADKAKLLEFLYGRDADDFTFKGDDLIPVEIRKEVAAMRRGFSLNEEADFLQAGADFARMMLGENESTTTTDIYLFMLIFWRVVDKLPTFEVFHDLTTKAFGHNRVGSDPKRLMQICQRTGKRFRLPGRPPKKLPQGPLVREVIS
jgi:hypothetical protein